MLPPQSPRGFSALARLYYLARPTKTAMLRRLREVKNSLAQECFKVAFGGPEVASKCPKVASELVRDIFEFFDLFFQGKFVICRLVWVLT